MDWRGDLDGFSSLELDLVVDCIWRERERVCVCVCVCVCERERESIDRWALSRKNDRGVPY